MEQVDLWPLNFKNQGIYQGYIFMVTSVTFLSQPGKLQSDNMSSNFVSSRKTSLDNVLHSKEITEPSKSHCAHKKTLFDV